MAGYARRWADTPRALIAAYAVLASICAVETFGYIPDEGRFVDMAIETRPTR